MKDVRNLPTKDRRKTNTKELSAAVPNNPAWRIKRPSPWPYKTEDSSVLTWWRKLPPDLFLDFERAALTTTLEHVGVLHAGEDVAAALAGDPAAAVGAALSLMPIIEITLTTDVVMTSLLRTALRCNATSALVMAQIVGLTDLGHEFAIELAASWFEYGRLHSDNPRKFSLAEDVLLAAFHGRRNQDLGA